MNTFPLEGGTGAIWKKVAKLLPERKQKYGPENAVMSLDKEGKIATLQSGQRVKYDALISTMPLDLTLQWLGKKEWADTLSRSSSHIVGLGIRGQCPHGLKCWLYFPEDDCPFYRTTVFSHYAPKNCPSADTKLPTLCLGDGKAVPDSQPEEGPFWSLMFEVSESRVKAVNNEVEDFAGGRWAGIVRECVQGALNTHLIAEEDQIVSLYHRRLEHGYPTPSLERDGAIAQALPWLRDAGIWSRGRFGSYKYEVGNQDHSLMLGVECADNVLFGSKELTLHHPNIVNAKKNTEILYSTPTFMSRANK
ncbi:g4254 [Coccomyxa viridis]|uniref:G4254 protein n=1 Tax=Coccomyxa viridis TaxID=1274662 RepID=A0ABP1FWS9_9CHLO